MIKAIHQVTIFDFDLIERTGKVNHLLKLPFVPVRFFIKDIEKLIKDCSEIISKNKNSDLESVLKLNEIEYNLKLNIEVLLLRSLEMLIVSLIDNRTTIMKIISMIRSRRLRKINIESDRLRWAINKAQILTGMQIGTLEDIKRFQKKVQTRCDKLSEFTSKRQQPTTDKKMMLIDVAQSIAMYLNLNPVGIEQMRIVHFAGLYQKSIEKMNKEKKTA